MQDRISRVVIVGGGSAGWLSAGVIAAEHRIGSQAEQPFELVLIESPDVPTIGVGEGTWPSMRTTLQRIGLSETDFIRKCDASFKQGTWFRNWQTGDGDTYSHPFTVPADFADTNLAPHWLALADAPPFADAVTPQAALFADCLAPKQITTPEYASVVNYAYHLDAGKFADLLRRHCTGQLGVQHIKANVSRINSAGNGDIESVTTDRAGDIAGDLFIDCTGTKSLLVGEHFEIPFQSRQAHLFNDTALAAQVPYTQEDQAIQSCTHATAQTAGWIWDIGLPTRRGTGHVYSSAHISEDEATAQLLAYIREIAGDEAAASVAPRKIRFEPGHRREFWHRNCVAIGMSSGFIEPLEASALVMIELAAGMIADQLPATRDVMDIVAKRYNRKFLRHWNQIIEFLKLHYVLSARDDSPYWQDNRAAASIPEKLGEQLQLWRYRSPWHPDAEAVDDLFPTASYQYILYGMGFRTTPRHTGSHEQQRRRAAELFKKNAARAAQLQQAMPSNRELLNKVREFGFQKL
ncbi:MAG: tryptophan 7-halogenase [Gammaproteobacteria bacterium]|nr:tryptophan 7-halogenase [Gammaproteobacteria bacterium]NNF50685.1 tryptophan 7-halogenase [Woeseiaceae bacterium]